MSASVEGARLADAAGCVGLDGAGTLSPEDLARRAQGGCLESFERIVLQFEARIFNFLQQFTRNRHDAEDLAQATFVKAYQNIHRYNSSYAFAPWLYTIARRTAANHFRSVSRREEEPFEIEVTSENPASLLASKDDQEQLWRIARTLKPNQWEVLWWRYAEGLSVAETARVMRTNQIHVKVLLHRARAALAKTLAARRMDFNALRGDT